MRTDVFIRDLNIGGIRPMDGRRIEIVADGLSLYHVAQLVIDTTLVSALRGDGTLHPKGPIEDGARLCHVRKRNGIRIQIFVEEATEQN